MILKKSNRKHILITLVVTTVLLCSFQSVVTGVSPDKFKAIYKKHQGKLVKNIAVHELNYSVAYVPVEMKIINLQKKKALSKVEINAIYAEYKKSKEFLLQLSISQFTNEWLKNRLDEGMDYSERVEYISFQMKNDIKFVLDKKDTIPCSNYIYERNFGTSPVTSIIIGFDTEKKYKKVEIILKDQLFNNDQLTFSFNSKDMNALPKLKNN